MVVACVAIVPTMAYAQSSITGVVRDTSGAVLPGVTVEAASPVLIEKVRAAVTDGTGQYRILDLRPGTYTVTFTLTGFSTVKREGFVLPADFVSTRERRPEGRRARGNGHRVAAKARSWTCRAPRSMQTLDLNMIQSIPTARGYAAVMLLIPSMVTSGGGNPNVQLSPGMIVFGGRGGRQNEGQSPVGRARHGRRHQRRRRVGLRATRKRAGSRHDHCRRPRGSGSGRTGRQHDSEDRREHVPESLLRLRHVGLDAERQLRSDHERLQQRRRRLPAEDPLSVGHQPFDSAGRSRRIGCGSSTRRRTRAAGARCPACITTRTPATSPSGLYEADLNRPAENGNAPGSIRPTLRLTAQVTPRNKLNMFWDPSPFRFADNVRRSAASPARRRGRPRPARSPEGRAGSRAPTDVWSRSGGRRRRRTGCCWRRAWGRINRTGTGASGRGTIAP